MRTEQKDYNIEYGVLSCIGILCVVMGHMGCDILSIDGWLPYASFHMPLFFFISGCFYKREVEEASFYKSIARLIKKLLLPFYFIYVLYWICYILLNKWFGCTIGIEVSLEKYLMAPIFDVQPIGFCAPAWFVVTLFGVRVVHLAVQKVLHYFKKNENKKCLFTIILYIVAGTVAFKIGDQIVFGWARNLLKIVLGLSFYQMGYLFHNYFEEKVNSISLFVYFSILILLREMLWIRIGWASIAMYSFSDIEEGYFVIVFSAMIGILFWYRISHYLSNLIEKNGLIIFISRHTFSIMINHLFVVFLIQGFIILLQQIKGTVLFDISAYKSQEYFVFSNNPLVLMILSFAVVGIIVCAHKGVEEAL